MEDSPIAFYRRPGDDAYEINLTAKDRKWSQFAYQFAHEYCHVLSGHERLRSNPNKLVSRGNLRARIDIRATPDGGTVAYSTPYANWTNYSESLAAYSGALVEKYRSNLRVDRSAHGCPPARKKCEGAPLFAIRTELWH